MHTTTARVCCSSIELPGEAKMSRKRRRVFSGEAAGGEHVVCWKRSRAETEIPVTFDCFDDLPDDLVLCILRKLTSSVSSPFDFVNVLITCKRLNRLGLSPLVLAKASPKSIAIKAKNWSESAHRFLKLCADAGNVEACYTLGMIRFYCLQSQRSGAALMARAAIASHAPALYSLAVIQFNGSGGSKGDKDLRAGVALCARAAFLGHVDALRELGHCLQDGYGVRQNISEGRRFLIQANARELASVLGSADKPAPGQPHQQQQVVVRAEGGGCPLLSDFGCDVPQREPDLANGFMVEWYERRDGEVGPGLRLCSYSACGRAETRRHEFRRCSVCGAVNYCSRACQALDWKVRHKAECTPVEQWDGELDDEMGSDDDEGGEEEEEDVSMEEEEEEAEDEL